MRQILVIVCLLFPTLVTAAGPIMHVTLAERYLALHAPNYTDDQKKQFILGTLFPDIRYLGVIRRDQSHFRDVTLKQVKKLSSPFKQGVLFHSYVDEKRHQWVKDTEVEKKINKVPPSLRGVFLKLIEDQILHDQKSWGSIRGYLTSILDEEKAYDIKLSSLTEWHTGLTVYFTALPSSILYQIGLFDKGILMVDPGTVKQWAELLPEYALDENMQKHVNDILSSFEKALTLEPRNP